MSALWYPDGPAARRPFDLYAVEKRAQIRAENVALFLLLAGVRAWHLSRGRAGDAARRIGRRHP